MACSTYAAARDHSRLALTDNPVNQEVARLQLKELGFAAHIAGNGIEALRLIEELRIGLIFMDCQMPEMDGFETTRRIRLLEGAGTTRTPIIAMTANAMEGDREMCLAAGMDDYVSKPLTSDRLEEVIEKWMLVAFSADDDVPVHSTSNKKNAAHEMPASDSGYSGSQQLVSRSVLGKNDLEGLLETLDPLYGPEASRKLLTMFIERTPHLLAELSESLVQHKAAAIKSASHELKGSCAALRLIDMEDICAKIELLARKSDNFGEMEDANRLLHAKFEHWRRLIELLNVNELGKEADPPSSVRIFIVEDNDVTRSGLRAILAQSSQFQVIGEASHGTAALNQIHDNPPDLVLVDIGLPDISGIEVTRRIKSQFDKVKALMFTSHDDEHDMFEAFSAGADGYVVKHDFDRARLELAIRSVARGNCWLDPAIASRILDFASRQRRHSPAPSVEEAHSPEPFTDEELVVLNKAGDCDGVCAASPSFLQRLHRFVES